MIPCEAYYLSLACHNAALLNVKLGRWADAQELVDEGIEFTKAPAIVVPQLACNKTHITDITDITYYHHKIIIIIVSLHITSSGSAAHGL